MPLAYDIVALDWNFENECLYAVVHGRDNLFRLWPQKYTRWESAMLPSEEFIKIEKGIILVGHIVTTIR